MTAAEKKISNELDTLESLGQLIIKKVTSIREKSGLISAGATRKGLDKDSKAKLLSGLYKTMKKAQ